MTINEKNVFIKEYNSFITYINKNIEPLLFKHGYLSNSYFKDNIEKDVDYLTSFNNINDIISNIDKIRNCHKNLKDGIKGMKISGKISGKI